MTQSFIVTIARHSCALLNGHTFGQNMDGDRTSKSPLSLQMLFSKLRSIATYHPSHFWWLIFEFVP